MEKVLVIEDDKMLSQLICKKLTEYGYEAFEIKRFYYVLEEYNEILPESFIRY